MPTEPARLRARTSLTDEITDFRFEMCERPLSGLAAGAHIDLALPEGLVRQYSVWDWDPAGRWFNIAVKREAAGRGGSRAVHALAPGALVEIGEPRNHFSLGEIDRHITLLAAGIGATPILPMARSLLMARAEFQVHYLARRQEEAAFDPTFCGLGLGERYHLHCSAEQGRVDLAALLQRLPAGSDVYVCGPEGLLQAVFDAGRVLRGGAIHFERFAAAADFAADAAVAFEVELARSGGVLQVGRKESLLDALRRGGLDVESACCEGLCGTCIVDVLEGEVEHRDGVLSPDDQAANAFMCTCVSRARSPRLVLDL